MKNHKGHNTHHKSHRSPHHTAHPHHHHTHNRHQISRMDQKKLTIAIVVVFALIIVAIGIILFVGLDREDPVPEPRPISVQCDSFCQNEQVDSFCFNQRRIGDGLRTTCNELATNPEYSQYGVQNCPAFDCTPVERDDTCEVGLNSEWVDATAGGECPEREGQFVINRDGEHSDNPPAEGQICCFYYD